MTEELFVQSAPPGEGDPPEHAAAFIARHRTVISVLAHGFLFALALLMAFGLAYNFHQVLPETLYSPEEARVITRGGWLLYLYLPMAALAIPIKGIVFALSQQYRRSWRYVGLRDLLGVISAAYAGSFLFMLSYFGLAMFRPAFAERLIEASGLGFRQAAVFLADLVATIGLVSVTGPATNAGDRRRTGG